MNEWDVQVADWLHSKAEQLHGLGVVHLCQTIASRSWRRNASDYDESAGDTPRSLGVQQSENLRELMLREYRDHPGVWADRGVEVSAPEQSLLVRAAGLALHPMKARNNSQQEPQWDMVRWSERSRVRQEAARQNRARYTPAFAPPFPGMETLGQDPDALGHAMVVYCGDLVTGRTAGWVAIPSADAAGQESRHPWMAVVPLWWDADSGGGRVPRADGDELTRPARFDTRPAPTPRVTLRPSRRPSVS